MVTAQEVEAIVRRALAPLEREVRDLKEMILCLDDPATRQQVERIVEETVATAAAPVLDALEQLGARPRRVPTRGQRAAAELVARASRAALGPPRTARMKKRER